jgi:hypothetical protein
VPAFCLFISLADPKDVLVAILHCSLIQTEFEYVYMLEFGKTEGMLNVLVGAAIASVSGTGIVREERAEPSGVSPCEGNSGDQGAVGHEYH